MEYFAYSRWSVFWPERADVAPVEEVRRAGVPCRGSGPFLLPLGPGPLGQAFEVPDLGLPMAPYIFICMTT